MRGGAIQNRREAEGTVATRRRDSRLGGVFAAATAAVLVGLAIEASAQTLPSGGSVAAGAATISQPSASTLNINQTSNRAIVNWQSFSVGQGGTVNFNQPDASSAILNRVTGSTPSSIAGRINAPGTVLLVNPNGIAITPTGTINVGSFAASTLDIKNDDFLAGRYKFTGNGLSAMVTNAGRINVSDGGFAALLGGRVANDGIISARLGRVGLGAGEKITLDLSGDGFLSVEVPSNQLGNLVDGTGQALVSNRGKIRADGGIVHLSAATASTILRDAVNVPGSIRANSVGTRGGRIVLGGGAGGRVNVAGRVSASGTRGRAPGNGGSIDISGAEIALAGARLNASGATGGGRIRIGGDAQGRGDFPHAQSVSIDSATVIRADATETGNGGAVVVWSDGHTRATGTFSARGGSVAGDGGLIETSGHTVDFAGIRVNASATSGRAGEWLIDPVNLTIDSAAAATISSTLDAGSNVSLLTTATTASGPGNQSAGAGDIIVNSAIGWTSAARLSLSAYGNIAINAAITGQNGTLALAANGPTTQTAPISVASLALDFTGPYVLNNAANSVRQLSNTTGGGCCGYAIQLTTLGDLRVTNVRAYGLTLNVGGSLSVTDTGILVPNNSNFIANVGGNVTFAGGENSFGAGTRVAAGGSITFNAPTSTWYGALFSADRDITINSTFTNNAGGTVAMHAFGGSLGVNNNIAFSSNGAAGGLELTALQNIVFNASSFGTANTGPVQITASAGGDIRFNAATNVGVGSTFNAGGLIASEASAPITMSGPTTFNSVHDIYINANLTSTDGGLMTLNADNNGHGTGTVLMSSTTQIWTSGGVRIFYHPSSYSDPSFYPQAQGGGNVAALKLVSTPQQFAQLNNLSGQNLLFALNNDIDFTGVNVSTMSQFNGSLNGFGHALLNVSMSRNTGDTVALFNVNAGGIANLGIVNGSFRNDNRDAASLAAINAGTITNVFFTGTVWSQGGSAGGLVVHNNGVINGASYATGTVRGSDVAGGLVGFNAGDLTQAYSSAHVIANTAGGLVGVNEPTGRIQYAYALGQVDGAQWAGGLVGINTWSDHLAGRNGCCGIGRGGGFISDTYASGQVNGTATGAGGLVGLNQFCDCGNDVNTFNSNSNSSASVFYSVWDPVSTGRNRFAGTWAATQNGQYSTEQVQMVEAVNGFGTFQDYRLFNHWTDATYTTATRGFNEIWYMIPGETRPFLRAEFSTTIQNAHQLQLMNMNPTATYTLARDISVGNELASGMWRGNSFSPIAPVTYVDQVRQTFNNEVYTPFCCETPPGFFAPGVTVINDSPTLQRTITSVYHYGGFGTPSLQNIIQTGQTVESVGTPAIFTGTLDGRGHTISGLSVVNTGYGAALFNSVGGGGTVRDLGIVDSSFSGGGAAAAALALTNFGTVDGVWVSNTQVSGSLQTGGLVGNNRGAITQSYADVNVSGGGGSGAVTGGLVGVNQGLIRDSYATGTVAGRGGSIVGGLVGFNLGSIVNTYSTGVLGVSDGGTLSWAGALVGVQGASGTTVNSYYDATTATHPSAVNSSSIGTGLTTAQMQDPNAYQSTYSGWDFRNVWAPPSSGYYPELYATSHIAVIKSEVTRQYGDSAAPLPMAVYGLHGADILNYAVSTSATSTSNAGTYAISAAPIIIPAVVHGYGAVSRTGSFSFGWRLVVNTIGSLWYDYSTAAEIASSLTRQGVQVTVDAAGVLTLTSNSNIVIQNYVNAGGACCLWGYGEQFAHLPTGTFLAQVLAPEVHGGSSYRIVNLASNNVTITPRQLDVTAVSGSSTYGDTGLSNPGVTVSGLVNGDTASGLGLANSFNISSTTNAGSYTLDVNGAFSNPNYQIARHSGTWTVAPAQLTVTANGGSSTYGGSPSDPGLSFTGLRNNDVIAGLSNLFGISSNTNAGNYTLSVNGAFNNANYQLTRQTGTWTVDRATIDVTATGGSSTYGASPFDPGFTATGLQNNQTVGVLAGLSNSFGITNQTNAGDHTLGVLGDLAANSNYTIRNRNTGTWTVERAPIDVTATSGSSTYGASPSDPGFTAIGLQNNQTIGVLTGLSNSFDITSQSNAGAYTLRVLGNLAANSNYTIRNRNTGTWTVERAVIDVFANGGTSIYGQSPTNPGFAASGLQNGEDVSVLTGLTNSFGITNLTNAGLHTLEVLGNLAASSNYTVRNRVTGTWTVERAVIDVTANGGRSTYGQSPNNPGLSATGLQNNEDVGVLAGLSNSFGITNLTNAGAYPLSVLGNLAASANYTIRNRDTGTWTVDRAAIDVSANGGRSIYGQSPINPGLTATGLQNGDSVGVLTGLSNSFGITNLSNAGSHILNVNGTLTNGNYQIANRNSGTWIVDPAAITVTANGGSSIYGQLPVNPGLTATGLQNGEGVGVLAGLTNSFGITNLSNAGNHALSVSGALTNANYTITARNGGIWTVNPAAITVTANGGTSVYGQSPINPGVSAVGLQNGEGVSVLTGLSNTFGITNLTGAGSHTLRVAGLLTNGNYTVTTRNEGLWTVDPAHVTVTATGGNSVYGQSPTNPGLSATGLQNGEGVGTLTGLTNAFGVSGTTGAGAYTLAVTGTLTNSNYVIDARNDGVWTVARAPITVAANAQSRLASEPDSLLTYRITSGQLFNGDVFSGALSREGGNSPPPGVYAITQGTLTTSPNYELAFVGSTLQVRAMPADSPSQFTASNNVPFVQANTPTLSFQPSPIPPVTFGSTGGASGTAANSTSVNTGGTGSSTGNANSPGGAAGGTDDAARTGASAGVGRAASPGNTGNTTVANTTAATDPTITATIERNRATGSTLSYLPISQFEAREYSNGALPGFEANAGEATVLTMIARAIAGERANTLFIDNFWNANASAAEFDLIRQRVTFADSQGNRVDPARGEPLPLTSVDPAGLLQRGPLMLAMLGPNGTQAWMLGLRMTQDGRGIVANDPATGLQVVLAYDAQTRTIGGVTGVMDMRTNTVIAVTDADALRAAGLDQAAPERTAALQTFAPTGYFAVRVN